MYRKIDDSVLKKIVALDNLDSKLDVIISYVNRKKIFEDINLASELNNFTHLPFISSIACTINYKDLYKLASFDNIKYITSNTKVSSLMYNAKKIINTNSIDNLKVIKESHSCVIIDTGIYPHVDFCVGRNRVIKFIDLINNEENMYDDNGHGTFVSGVFCGAGIVDNYDGVDSNSNIIVIKALDKGGETTAVKILESMQWVLDNKDTYNIKVVCMSFGSIVGEKKDPLMYGAEVLWNNGIVVVSAAGNNGPNERSIMSPGASRKVITVGALDTTNIDNISVADFSSRGPAFDYYKPDIVVPGVDIISTNIFKSGGNFYTKMSGTSVSTPIVAGVVSLLFNHNINYTPDEIKYMIVNSAIKVTGDRNSEGFGRLDLTNLKLL